MKNGQDLKNNNREKATSGQALEIVKSVVSAVPSGFYKDVFEFFIENPKVFKAHLREMMDFDKISKDSLLLAYSEIGTVSEGAIAVCKKDNCMLHIDAETGYPLYNKTFIWVGNYHNGYAVVQSQDSRGDKSCPDVVRFHIDKTGRRIYDSCFKSVENFVDGVAAARLCRDEMSWAYINTAGQVISPLFLWADSFVNSFARVRSSSDVYSWYHINRQFMPIYQERYAMIGNFNHGLAPVTLLNGNWGYIDITGKRVHNAKEYREAGEYNADGIAGVVWYEDGTTWVANIDVEGKTIDSQPFVDIL